MKKRLFSLWSLLMLFIMSSSAVPLTSVPYSGTCDVHLNEAVTSGNTIYGNGSVPASAYADLSGYSTLTLTGTNVANARLLFNRLIDEGDVVQVIPGNSPYATVNGNVAIIDLQAIANDNNQIVRLMVIKSNWGQTVTINSWELEPLVDNRQAVEWNIDNGITIDDENVKDKFNNDNPIFIPVRNSDFSTWTISPRFKVRLAGTSTEIPVEDLCNGSFDASYFEVIYSNSGFLSHQSIDYNGTPAKPRIKNLTANKRGVVSMTFAYKGNANYKPFSKTYFFNIEGMPCEFKDWNSAWNVYEKYIDDGEFREIYGLFNSNNQRVTMATLPTVTAVDELGEPITSKVVNFYSNSPVRYYSNQQGVDIHLIPNTLGTVTYKVEYPGDDIYNPTVYMFDVKIKQHMVELRWVDPQGNETDEWKTSLANQYGGIPMLKLYIDNVEVSLSDWASRLQFSSSQPDIASMKTNGQNPTNSSAYVDFHAGGLTVIEARFLNQYKTVDGLNYYYYNDEAASYTMILTYGSSGDQPHIVWISGSRYGWTETTASYGNNARGSYLGQKWIDAHHTNPEWLTDDLSQYTQAAKPNDYYPFKGDFTHYGNNVYVSAVALKSSITDADLANIHIFPIPGYKHHYYVRDDENNEWWVNAPKFGGGTWRVGIDIPDWYFFDPSDKLQNRINYMVDRPAMLRDSKTIAGSAVGDNFNEGREKSPQSVYKFTPAYASQDSLKVYAYIEGYDVFSSTKILVAPGDLQLRFVPDSGTVNAGQSILPYVNCPDLRMEDVKKIWLTYDCPNTLNVEDQGVVYEAGVTTNDKIAKYLKTVTANDTIWVNPDDHRYGIQETRPTTWLRGINPEIFGLQSGIGSECTVTLHLTSDMYQEATATYTLTVEGNDGDKPMFHWAVNDKVENSKHVDDNVIKKISVAEGDFIYMPGIVGNSNGNKEYSEGYTFKYLYAIKNGVITMNRAKYFPGEGVPNYYLTYAEGGEPAIPQSGDNLDDSQPAIITWAIGLGGDQNKDSLMIYGNKAGVMYLYAQDPQTHKTCTPIQITVVPKAPLNQAKQTELAGMTYPFTWDFEHMDMTKYVADVENNSGTYWQKKYVEESKTDHEQGPKRYHRNYSVEKPFYQYNGGMNADWDDKDLSGSSRQRWFKDIYTGDGETVEYAPEFKGIMLNLSGLDYWEQKYQRFQIDKQGRFIYFEGGPIFLQLPGFGLTQNKNGKLKTELQGTQENPGTRSFDNYIGGEHNHINTAKYNVNEGYTQMLSVDNTKNKTVEYPVQEKYRNNKVRFVIKARGGRTVKSDSEIPNTNSSSQFHIGGASMIIENLTINDINWTQGVHNGYSYYNLDNDEPKVYIVELDPYDPELQDHIYLMFNNDVYVYWMAITNEPRDILSDFDGVTYSYPKDIDMEKTNLTLGMQSQEGIYTKADASGNYKLASVGEHTIKNVYQVGSDEPGKGTKVQLKAYRVDQFYPVADGTHPAQSVTLTEVEGNLPKNEGVMLYTEPRMSALTANGGHVPGLTAQWYDRGNTAWSEYVTVVEDGEEIQKEIFHVALATDSTGNGNMYNNSHTYYTFPLYFIAMAENMSSANYELKKPGSTGGGVWGDDEPAVANGSVNREGANLLRPVTYGKTLDMDYGGQQLINFGYNNEFICRHLIYQNGTQTKEMDPNDLYVSGSGSNAHEDMYYYRIGPAEAKFYRINTAALNHHNRSAYMTLTWDEYKVNTVGKPINIENSDPTSGGSNDPGFSGKSPIRFSPTSNPVEILFRASGTNDQVVSEDGGFVDGINEVERTSTESNAVYNLNGVRVNNVSKGIYVIDGKKVVVK